MQVLTVSALLLTLSLLSTHVDGQDIVAALNARGNFTLLIAALTKADLLDTFNSSRQFTFFAPNNTAISNLPENYFDTLLAGNKQKLQLVLTAHLFNGLVSADTIRATKLPNQWNTTAAINAIVDKIGDKIKLNAATVTNSYDPVDNVLIHVIDQFLVPLEDGVKTLTLAGDFKNFTAALNATDLLGLLKNDGFFTVFAPTDAAFAKLPEGVLAELLKSENKAFLTKILKYHMVGQLLTRASINRLPSSIDILMLAGVTAKISRDGGAIKINGLATVAPSERFSTNGMIHSVDTVLLPPLDMVEVALINGNFKTLISALKQADLINTLKSIGPFTLFAPNDDTFAKFFASDPNDLLNIDNKEKLSKLLTYHVFSGEKILPSEFKQTQQLEMLAGESATVVRDGSNLKINGATFTLTSVLADNGVIYTVEKVLTLKPDLPSSAHAYGGPFGTLLSTLLFVYHACL